MCQPNNPPNIAFHGELAAPIAVWAPRFGPGWRLDLPPVAWLPASGFLTRFGAVQSMWGSGPDNIYATGDNEVTRWDGTEWRRVQYPDWLNPGTIVGTEVVRRDVLFVRVPATHRRSDP